MALCRSEDCEIAGFMEWEEKKGTNKSCCEMLQKIMSPLKLVVIEFMHNFAMQSNHLAYHFI